NDDQTHQDGGAGLADYFTFDYRVGMAVNTLSNRHRIAADFGVFSKLDAPANGNRVSAHRTIHDNIAENCDRIAAGTGHLDRAKNAPPVADMFVRPTVMLWKNGTRSPSPFANAALGIS